VRQGEGEYLHWKRNKWGLIIRQTSLVETLMDNGGSIKHKKLKITTVALDM
jgi:hypothetical protein